MGLLKETIHHKEDGRFVHGGSLFLGHGKNNEVEWKSVVIKMVLTSSNGM